VGWTEGRGVVSLWGMTLEDHAGDVVRKSRLMMDVSAGEAAAAGGISLEALSAFESSGEAPAGLDWERLAARLDLSGEKLRRVAGGWLPEPVDTARWRELRVITTEGNGMTVNAFLVWDPQTRDAALFDTGFDAEPIVRWIEGERLNLRQIFITHTHGDHVAALEPLRVRYAGAGLHTNAKAAPAVHRNQPGACIEVGSLRITHRETVGHAEDGVTYVIRGFGGGAPEVAVVGDAMFAGSIGGAPGKGRPTKQAIREQILSLPAATLVCPGHGPLTTVGEQARVNPFFG